MGETPSRGVIEVKPLNDDAWVTANSAQVSRDRDRYSQVLVTNYRDFHLAGQGPDGHPALLEPAFRLGGLASPPSLG